MKWFKIEGGNFSHTYKTRKVETLQPLSLNSLVMETIYGNIESKTLSGDDTANYLIFH